MFPGKYHQNGGFSMAMGVYPPEKVIKIQTILLMLLGCIFGPIGVPVMTVRWLPAYCCSHFVGIFWVVVSNIFFIFTPIWGNVLI